jgi:precorrin-6A synthase
MLRPEMRKILVIGIGTGNPEHVTVQAIKALNRLNVVFLLDKGEDKRELLALRREICERYIERRDYRTVAVDDVVRDPGEPSYARRVDDWHAERAAILERLFASELGDDQCGGILVWGDPSLYDSTLRILERVRERGRVAFECEVIPGITSIQALCASHQMPLNRIGGSVQITTGRKLAEAGKLEADDAVVMLDGGCAFKHLAGAEELEILWGAYLGSEHEIVRAGRVSDVADEIERVRTAARAEHGWIMDTYLLRKTGR